MRTPREDTANSPGASSSSPPTPLQPSSTTQHTPRRERIRSHRSRRNSHHHHQHHQRYHFNHIEAGMPVNIWGIDRRDVWRTCFCFHVRTVTIFIGVCHLMLYILYLSFLAAMFMYGTGSDNGRGRQQDPMLPTPISVSNTKQFNEGFEINPKSDSLTIDQSENPRARLDPLNMVMDTRKANSQVVLLTVCNMLITLLMVYGAVRGKPSYLMPFFVLRVFDFCIFCLTMVGYFSYLPNVTDSISNAHWIPNREAIIEMDPQILSLITLLAIVILIAIKAYIIGVVWNCYKYLMLRNSVIRTVIAYRHDDPANLMAGLQQNLLPDLPDYDTAVNDPRYAKKPPIDPNAASSTSTNGNATSLGASTVVVPPPPYSVAVAAEPLTYSFIVPSTEQPTTTEENQQAQVETSEMANNENTSENEIHTPATVTQTTTVIEVAPAPVETMQH